MKSPQASFIGSSRFRVEGLLRPAASYCECRPVDAEGNTLSGAKNAFPEAACYPKPG